MSGETDKLFSLSLFFLYPDATGVGPEHSSDWDQEIGLEVGKKHGAIQGEKKRNHKVNTHLKVKIKYSFK